MKKEDKGIIISELSETIKEYNHFYLADIEALDAVKSSNLRRACFKEEIKLVVVKNKLLRKALENVEGDFEEIFKVLKGNTSVMFCNTGNVPAKLIKELGKKGGKPVLKAAYVEECAYVGENQLDVLTSIKSKNELIGEIIALLQSPAKNVISALQSGGNTIHGVLKTLGERES